jgi:peptidoglycan hydrolase-like protein with peptidoglycan-binding domain
MPAVLVEMAFINNPSDIARFNVNTMAQAIAEGIREAVPLGGGGGGTAGGLPPYPGTLLRVGSVGESVRQVQRCLNRVATRHPSIGTLTEDGIFGPRTLNSVTTFQRIFGLTADGIVGPITWDRLSRECAASSGAGGLPPYPGTPLRVGSTGESVRQVQRCLNRVAARHPSINRLVEDGVFGPRTLESVTTFQRIFGLAADGVVGPITWDRLSREC